MLTGLGFVNEVREVDDCDADDYFPLSKYGEVVRVSLRQGAREETDS